MKTLTTTLILLFCLTSGSVFADSPDSGFYLGFGGNLQWIMGTGTWDGQEFDIGEQLSDIEGATIGFAWSENILLGVKPLMGYKLSPLLTLQVGYGLNIPKATEQIYSESETGLYYEQGLRTSWTQRNLEILLSYHPSDNGLFFYGGWDRVEVSTEVTLFEGVEYENTFGDILTDGQTQILSDSIVANGLIVGVGVELPSESRNLAAYFSAQYSTAKTNGSFFDTPDFNVQVGGFSLLAGVKWFPGEGSPSSVDN